MIFTKNQLKTCSFFGHRIIFNRNSVYNKLKSEVENLIKQDVKKFLVGTHGEFDSLVLSVLRELRKIYKDIKIVVVFTSLYAFKKDEWGFSFADSCYRDVETTTYEIEDEHYKRQIIKSNQCMIDESDYVVCFVNPNKIQSGAKIALKYAMKTNKKITNIYC